VNEIRRKKKGRTWGSELMELPSIGRLQGIRSIKVAGGDFRERKVNSFTAQAKGPGGLPKD